VAGAVPTEFASMFALIVSILVVKYVLNVSANFFTLI
jgi:hypothetical protein